MDSLNGSPWIRRRPKPLRFGNQISDLTMSAIHSALSGLTLRQRAIADNVANINTPGYLATRVDFESSLRSALSSGTSDVNVSSSKSLAATRTDGNNVDLDTETMQMV